MKNKNTQDPIELLKRAVKLSGGITANEYRRFRILFAKGYDKVRVNTAIYTRGNRFDTSVLSLEEEVMNCHVSEPEIYVCHECGLTWEIEECRGNKCPVCQTTLEYMY